jgi:multicomponent Na+:H+ antiporter subunit C
MEFLVLLVVASFIAGGVYLILDRTLLRVALGLGLLSNGTNLFLLSSGGVRSSNAPILDASHENGEAVGHAATVLLPVIADPIPQALILTAIVISFGVTALLLVVAYRTHQSYGSDDLADLHGRLNDE